MAKKSKESNSKNTKKKSPARKVAAKKKSAAKKKVAKKKANPKAKVTKVPPAATGEVALKEPAAPKVLHSRGDVVIMSDKPGTTFQQLALAGKTVRLQVDVVEGGGGVLVAIPQNDKMPNFPAEVVVDAGSFTKAGREESATHARLEANEVQYWGLIEVAAANEMARLARTVAVSEEAKKAANSALRDTQRAHETVAAERDKHASEALSYAKQLDAEKAAHEETRKQARAEVVKQLERFDAAQTHLRNVVAAMDFLGGEQAEAIERMAKRDQDTLQRGLDLMKGAGPGGLGDIFSQILGRKGAPAS